jgi:hypothetical protein
MWSGLEGAWIRPRPRDVPSTAELPMVMMICCAALASTATVFNVDLSQPPVPFASDVLTRTFGSSHASTALTTDWQAQLKKVHDDLGTEFVRFHGLLDDDMSVVIPSAPVLAPTPTHNCTFVAHRDYSDPAGPVLDATSAQECCTLCYEASTGLPQPCIAAVFAAGKCYTKLAANHPYDVPGGAQTACVTSRPSPAGFSFSFTNIFRVFDFIVSIGMRPLVELSFMPSLLATDPSDVGFWYRGGHSPPKRWDDWTLLLTELVRALELRYGAEEVRSWYFEVWNEPNCVRRWLSIRRLHGCPLSLPAASWLARR